MLNRFPFLIGLCLIMGFGRGSYGQAGEDSPRNIVLIGWDGAQRDHVEECLSQDELPNLAALIKEGTMVDIDVTGKTDTKAGWAEILTGYGPEVTGVFGNNQYGPIPVGYTVFERLESHFGRESFVTVAVVGKGGNVGCDWPPGARKVGKKKKARALKSRPREATAGTVASGTQPAQPYYYTKDHMDLFVNNLGEDQKVGGKALDLLDRYRETPFFFFVHFGGVDHEGHKFGENSKEYNDALVSADHWTGEIIDKLKQLGLYEQSLIYVTADHGFDEGLMRHRDAPYVFLATNDPKVMRPGLRGDITPTILASFGIDLSAIDPPLDGHPLTEPYTEPIW